MLARPSTGRKARLWRVRATMTKGRRHNAKGRSNGTSRYVAIMHWVMRTPAWRDLDCVARCAYLELASRYAGPGSNNGRIPYSVREMALALGTSKATALRALKRLQEHGFVVLTKAGKFAGAQHRDANEWRLTEFGSDVTGELATKDFTRWQSNFSVSSEHLNRCRDETGQVSS